jgi:DNA-binding NtrC family response regulator
MKIVVLGRNQVALDMAANTLRRQQFEAKTVLTDDAAREVLLSEKPDALLIGMAVEPESRTAIKTFVAENKLDTQVIYVTGPDGFMAALKTLKPRK